MLSPWQNGLRVVNSLINHASLARFTNKPDLVQRLVRVYLESAHSIVQSIEAGADAGDMEQVAFGAHSLKGSSVEIGAEQLALLSQQLQEAARSGDRASVAPLAKNVSGCYQQTLSALEPFLRH